MNSKQALRAIRGEKALRQLEQLHADVSALATLIGAAKRLATETEDSTLQRLLDICHGTAETLQNDVDLLVDPLPA